jgi:hypothetical protein
MPIPAGGSRAEEASLPLHVLVSGRPAGTPRLVSGPVGAISPATLERALPAASQLYAWPFAPRLRGLSVARFAP